MKKSQNSTTKSQSEGSKSSASSVSKKSSRATSMAELMGRTQVNPGLKKGTNVTGRVKKLDEQEILLDIGAKSDALVLEYDRRNMQQLLSLLTVGQEIEARVLFPESEEGYPIVSLRPFLQVKVFAHIEESYKNHSSMPVTVVGQTRSGYFVESEQGVKGFLPSSHVLTTEDIMGTTLAAQVIDFDRASQRVVFSQKATAYVTDPAEIAKYVKAHDLLKGVVSSISPYGLYVTITPKVGVDIEGFVHVSEISHNRINVKDLYAVGDVIDGEVLTIDEENRRVNLSIKKLMTDKFEKLKATYKLEQKVSGKVLNVSSRGVLLEIEDGVQGLIPVSRIAADTQYKEGEMVKVEVTDFDSRRRVIVVSPVLTSVPLGYR